MSTRRPAELAELAEAGGWPHTSNSTVTTTTTSTRLSTTKTTIKPPQHVGLLEKRQWQQHRLETQHISSPTPVATSPSRPYHSTMTSGAKARHMDHGWGSRRTTFLFFILLY